MARKKVTSVPALADWGAVDNALRDIRECQHTLAEMAVQRDRQIDSIKADYAQGALPLQNRVKALESEVKAYVDLHRAELDGKSRALNFGTVGYRVSSKLMLASNRVAEAIATLKVLGHAELIKTTETLDREALKRQPGDILQQVGAYIRTVDEFLSRAQSASQIRATSVCTLLLPKVQAMMRARRSTQIGSTTSSIGCRSRVPTALLQTLATPKSLSSPAPRTVCCTKRRPKARRLIWSC